MLTIDNLTLERLKKPEEFQEFKQMILDFLARDNVDEARDLYEKLLKEVPIQEVKNLPNEYEEYENLLKLIILSTLSDKEAVNVMEKQLVYTMKRGIDISGKLDSLYILYADEYNDFKLHHELARSLARNIEILGKKRLIIKGEDKPVNPTVENWIRDFLSHLQSDKVPSQIDEAEYLSKSNNVKALSKEDVELLKKILRLYNYLRFPVRTRDKVRDTGHSVGKDIQNTAGSTMQNILPADPLARLKTRYNNYRRSRWNILKLEDEILMQTKGDNEALKKELSAAAREYNSQKLIACIKILGRQNNLLESLRQSPSWQNSLKDYIVSKYAPTSEPEDITYVVQRLNDNYRNPAVISEFLQYLLLDKMKMEKNIAALTAIEIGQLLGSDYELIAYGDQETGEFVFSKNKIENKQLVMEK